MDAAVAALLGAAIGAIGSLGGAWFQQAHQTRRERLKLATDLGIADFNNDYERAKQRGGVIPPLSAYVMYHAEFLDALSKGAVSADTVRELNRRQEEVLKAFPDPAAKKS